MYLVKLNTYIKLHNYFTMQRRAYSKFYFGQGRSGGGVCRMVLVEIFLIYAGRCPKSPFSDIKCRVVL